MSFFFGMSLSKKNFKMVKGISKDKTPKRKGQKCHFFFFFGMSLSKKKFKMVKKGKMSKDEECLENFWIF